MSAEGVISLFESQSRNAVTNLLVMWWNCSWVRKIISLLTGFCWNLVLDVYTTLLWSKFNFGAWCVPRCHTVQSGSYLSLANVPSIRKLTASHLWWHQSSTVNAVATTAALISSTCHQKCHRLWGCPVVKWWIWPPDTDGCDECIVLQ